MRAMYDHFHQLPDEAVEVADQDAGPPGRWTPSLDRERYEAVFAKGRPTVS